MADFLIAADDRARFRRCRRQWDFGSPHRRNLEPVSGVAPSLEGALRDALAVYYYPGTWDWPHSLTQSLVHKAFSGSGVGGGDSDRAFGAALLDCYDAWALTVDDFAPVKINYDLRVLVPDPRDRSRGLVLADGSAVKYSCEVDLLVADRGDEYWVVRHQIVSDWQDLESLKRDVEAVAACWAWEQEFMGMTIAGTIHNEVRTGRQLKFPGAVASDRAVAQNEPSGGGRSFPQHERAMARSSRVHGGRISQREAGVLRRTRIRRGRTEVNAVPARIAAEVLEMTESRAADPSFGSHCAACEFTAPCLAMLAGRDPEPLLARGFRERAAQSRPTPKLGQSTWGFGRGAAPPDW
ncbi:MAG: hypothetical protein JO152_04340 [Mycobacteriaceae bacterium]|nr:hypothetical protein [Mycobacteriaceae bacterium]